MFSPRSVSLFGSLFVLLSASTAAAVTGSVCLRNDGVGTFSSNDLTVYAISIPSSGFGQAWGPSSSLAPGSGVCITVNGLNAWTGFQYQYVFDISFTDSTGTVTFSSGTNLQLGSSGTQYISANGVSTVQPLLAD
jgi:hypothetical protein